MGAARNALANCSIADPTQAVCLLMAEIEEGQNGDQGKAREWLARAVRAPRDPAWTADGIVTDEWEPVSPVTGELDAFEWKVPAQRRRRAGPEAPAAAQSPPRRPDRRNCRLHRPTPASKRPPFGDTTLAPL